MTMEFKTFISITASVLLITVIIDAYVPHSTFGSASKFGTPDTNCPCIDPYLCHLIPDSDRKEVFGFSVSSDITHWINYDWHKLTTVAMVGYVSDELMCMAHEYLTKVSYIADINVDILNATLRAQWIKKEVAFMQQHYLDGINFDYEKTITKDDNKTRIAFTALVADMKAALTQNMPYSQVTVDVPYKPDYYGRYYDYKGLANASDFLFVMAYDENPEAIANSNSPLYKAKNGLELYMDLGMKPQQLLLGLPWYGYYYHCLILEKYDCFHAGPTPQYPYSFVHTLALKNEFVVWNETSNTPFFNYLNATDNTTYQMQFDNPQSLKLKYDLATKMDVRGVGIWELDKINYTHTATGKTMRKEMFGALPQYKQNL